MIKIIFLLLSLICLNIANAQFSITVQVRTLHPVEVSLEDLNNNVIFSETLKVGGIVEYKASSIVEDYYNLKIGEFQQYILLENSQVIIKGFLTDNKESTIIRIEGTPKNNLLDKAEQTFKNTGEHNSRWSWNAVKDDYDIMVLAALIYKEKGFFRLKQDILKEATEKITKKEQNALVIKSLQEMYENTKLYAEGIIIEDFSLQNSELVEISLSDINGKYLLLDFWASWCGPCLKEIENLKAIYEEVKHMNIEFIGISLDDTKESWNDGLNRTQVPWVMLWDKDGFQNSKFKDMFGFNQIPFIVLLSPEREIIARNLRGEEVKNEILKHLKY